MKHLKLHLAIALNLLIAIVFFSQCSRNKAPKAPPKIDPAFTGFISAFTSGVISNQSVITIRLVDIASSAEVGKEIEEKIFSFSPKIKGKAYWTDNRTIEFKPDNLLPQGKTFDAQFHLSKVMDVPDKVKTLKFNFNTIKQAIRVEYTGNNTYNNNDLTWQQLKGKLLANDHISEEKLPELLTAVQNGKALKINWEYDADGTQHKFTIDSVSRFEKKSQVILEWNANAIGADSKGDEVIEIPPLGDFKVLNTQVNQIPEQYITVYFSDPLNPDQELEGLIHLSNNRRIRLEVSDNIVKVYPSSRITQATEIIVEQGVRNIMNYQLIEQYKQEIKFSNIKPDVELIGNGVILPSSNGLIFPFKAVNLRAVNVKIIKIFENNIAQFLQTNQFDGTRELKRVGRIVYKDEVALTSEKPIDYGSWNSFALDLSEMITAEPGAIYRVHITFTQNHSLYPCESIESTKDSRANQARDNREEASFDGPSSGYYYYDDYNYYYDNEYNYQEKDNPCKPSYYLRNRHSVARNILASDLGIIAKGGNSKELFVAITDIKSTQPLSNVQIDIFNFQNQLITTATTDAKGMARISLESKPFLLVAKKDNQIGYLRLDDGSSLSMSMFDIGGQKNKKGLKGYIYGERGVWRPGDSLFVTFMLEDKNNILPEDHPVSFELYTPENQLYLKRIKTNPVNGFYDFRTATSQDAPTGNWLAIVRIGGSKFSKTLKIETVKPNRLKIKLDFNTDILRSGEPVDGNLKVTWLHGAIAKNLNSDVVVTLNQGKTKFDDYPGFNFDDAAKEFTSEELTIFDGQLNEKGEAKVSPKISVGKQAPGMVNASFKIRAFEKGGDFSVDRFTIPYSPYESYVGLKVPKGEGWNGAIYSNEPNLIPILSLDENGNKVDRENIVIEVYEIRWRWWWERSEQDNLARYIRNNSSKIIKTDFINTKDGEALYELNFGSNTWGRKYIKITDPVSGHSAGQIFYTSYKGWWNNSGQDSPGGAEMLTFSTDKSKYNVGEQVAVELPASESGRALVSLESGSKIIDVFWVETSKENHSFSFEAKPEMAPNIYVHISYIQSHNQVKNDLPIRLYGVQPISVQDPQTHLTPVITMPDILAPEEAVTIQVSETDGKKMTYTLAVVDEGLLDLTRFATPNAWKQFYAREALGIKTWDMYKYVLGAFSGEMAGLLALGGDEEIGQKGGQKANRFKPVVKFLGPFELGAGKSASHTFTMPNYVGSVRIMVVGGNNQTGAYGSSEKATPVRKPVMVLATLPRVVGPTEKVKLPVTVFAMDESVKDVSVELETNELFSIEGAKKQSIKFTEPGDGMVYFDLNVNSKIGIGTIKVKAKSGKEKAEYNIEIDVRLPNPRVTKVAEEAISPEKVWNTSYKAIGVTGTNNGLIEISTIPPIDLDKRLKYLIRYPHGCIEQTTSSVFPQLFMSNLMELSNEQKDDIQNNILAGIERLRTFQISNGGLSYWPGEVNDASDWGTNYAGHFMLEAKIQGYNLPAGYLDNWIKFQRKRANEWTNGSSSTRRHYYNSSQLIQAYRLYTLALAGKPAMGAMNRMREQSNLSVSAQWRLAAAYQLAGREDVAKKMINNLSVQIEPYKELSYSYGSRERDQAMILETLTLLGQMNPAKNIIEELSDKLSSSSWYSTQTTAYSLMAISKFVGTSGETKELDFTYSINKSKATRITTESAIKQIPIDLKTAESGAIQITNNSTGVLFAKVILDGIPLTGDNSSASNNLNMSIKYLDMDGGIIDPTKLIQGTDFMAEVRIHHPGVRWHYKEMALTQIFPSGWEIKNMRMEEVESVHTADIPRYQDIRDDRVYSYFDLQKSTAKTYRVLLNAAYLGKFYLPTVYCEAMYDNEINAQIPGKWVQVVAADNSSSQSTK